MLRSHHLVVWQYT